MKLPFSVFKRTDRRFYLVKFRNNQTGGYFPPLNTKKETEAEAIQVAFEWLKNGIPTKKEEIPFKKYSLRDMAKEIELNKEDAKFICKELQRQGFLKNFVLSESSQAIDFIQFLQSFWDWNSSPYVKERLRKQHAIHQRYTTEMTGAINRYWVPFFEGKDKLLGEITRKDIEDFVLYLESFKEKAEEEQSRLDRILREEEEKETAEIAAGIRKPRRKNVAQKKRIIVRFPKSAKRINTIIQAGTIALKWAFNKELIDRDVTNGITWFSGKSVERQILSPEQAAAVFKVEWKDNRARLANMLAMVTGMRAGEIQGLRIQDLGNDCLYVRHSWNLYDGLKTTKNNESRMVEVPFPGLMQELIELAKDNPHRQDMDSYVFWAEKTPDKPMEQDIFRRDLKDALVKSGMSKESTKAYSFHAWRHYFTSYMRERVNEKLLQQQTGHKELSMLYHYSDHRIAGDRERIQKAQIASFAGLLPEKSIFAYKGNNYEC
jgi:integrase